MDFDLNNEQRMYHDAVRDFCEKELAPYAAEVDHAGQLRWEAIKKMPALGLTGLQVPEEYGGAAMDTVSAALALEEVARACGSTALSIAAHNGLGCFPIVKWGSKEQKEKYLPRLTSGEYLGALALTEPDAGSDLAGGVKTNAYQDGDTWVLNGHKAWITNPGYAPAIITLTRTDKEAGTRGFSMLLVEPDMAGVTVHPPEKKMGLKGSPTQQITYDNVRVPVQENTLGAIGRGFHQTMETLDGGRITIGAISIGIAQAAFEAAIQYAADRQAFGKPIAQHQAIQWMIADAALEIEAARLMVMRAAWLKDQGRPFVKEAAMGKLMASEVAERVCFNSIQIHGSYGYSQEFPVERMYRDQRLMTIGEGTSQIQRLVIARRVLEDAGLH
ncbi:MAG: acyl-CoA dehydrogenase family protein [Anaerolineales bacterium]|nr:acyl-CoA dehydrogenase family protein [Anaerolineales bacterium]